MNRYYIRKQLYSSLTEIERAITDYVCSLTVCDPNIYEDGSEDFTEDDLSTEHYDIVVSGYLAYTTEEYTDGQSDLGYYTYHETTITDRRITEVTVFDKDGEELSVKVNTEKIEAYLNDYDYTGEAA